MESTPQLLASTRISLARLCCLIRPFGIWCSIPGFTTESSSNISESDIARLNASEWLRSVASCIEKESSKRCGSAEAAITYLRENIANSAQGRRWDLDWNSDTSTLEISNKGESDDVALLAVVARDANTSELFEIDVPVNSAVVKVPLHQSVSVRIPLIRTFKSDQSQFEFTVFSADAVGLNGDGIASLQIDAREARCGQSEK